MRVCMKPERPRKYPAEFNSRILSHSKFEKFFNGIITEAEDHEHANRETH